MRTAYKLYQVNFTRHGHSEMTIEALSRKGSIYIAHLKRTDDRYWDGGTDFGWSDKKTFKGIVLQFFQHLEREVRDYDNRWYYFHCMVRAEYGGNRPLTWDETYEKGLVNEDEPTFKVGVTFKII